MDASLLDTDTLSEILKRRNAATVSNAATYLQQHGQFTFSAFSRFEVRRGYLDKRASQQLAKFDEFCGHSLVLPLSDRIFDEASRLWTLARQGGHPKADADVLIAATAIQHNLVLVTGNGRHFSWMPGLQINDWRVR
jgi:tRNA(fMet)-specific endonuclease VapC